MSDLTNRAIITEVEAVFLVGWIKVVFGGFFCHLCRCWILLNNVLRQCVNRSGDFAIHPVIQALVPVGL